MRVDVLPERRSPSSEAHTVGVVQVGLVGRAPPVDVVEVEARGPEVDQRLQLVLCQWWCG